MGVITFARHCIKGQGLTRVGLKTLQLSMLCLLNYRKSYKLKHTNKQIKTQRMDSGKTFYIFSRTTFLCWVALRSNLNQITNEAHQLFGVWSG